MKMATNIAVGFNQQNSFNESILKGGERTIAGGTLATAFTNDSNFQDVPLLWVTLPYIPVQPIIFGRIESRNILFNWVMP